MQQENELAKSLATTSTMLAKALEEKDMYMDVAMRRAVENDRLKAENAKLRSDLEFSEAERKNAVAALKVRDKVAEAAAKDETPFTGEEG